jgi:hypothetical protein
MLHMENGLVGGHELPAGIQHVDNEQPGNVDRQIIQISNCLAELGTLCTQAFVFVSQRIAYFLKNNFEILFFAAATAYSAMSFPSLFLGGLPVGALFSFLVGQTAEHRGLSSDFYIWQKYLLAGAIVQSTLGTLNLLGKTIVQLNAGRFSIAHEGITSSILAGALTGSFLLSGAWLVTEKIRIRFFG